MHPHRMTPSARALYWYLMARSPHEAVDVRTATKESGIPVKTIYEQVRKFPQMFQLLGSSVRRTPRTPRQR